MTATGIFYVVTVIFAGLGQKITQNKSFGGIMMPLFLFILIFYSTYCVHSFHHIHTIHSSRRQFTEVPLHLLIAGQLSGKTSLGEWGAELRIELGHAIF